MKPLSLITAVCLTISLSAQSPFGRTLERVKQLEEKATKLSDLEAELLDVENEVEVKYEYKKSLATGSYRFAGYVRASDSSKEKLEFVTFLGQPIPTTSFDNEKLVKQLSASVKENGPQVGIITVNLFTTTILLGDQKAKAASITKVYSFTPQSAEEMVKSAEAHNLTAEQSKEFKDRLKAE